jgi:hypothetical protein
MICDFMSACWTALRSSNLRFTIRFRQSCQGSRAKDPEEISRVRDYFLTMRRPALQKLYAELKSLRKQRDTRKKDPSGNGDVRNGEAA